MATFIDTNLIVYAFDASEPNKQAIARSILADPPDDPTVSSQVLAEFYVVTTTKLSPALSPEQAAQAVVMLSKLHVVPIDAQLVSAAAEMSRKSRISFWDAQIIEAAARAGCERVLTEDLANGQTFDNVTIENPFA